MLPSKRITLNMTFCYICSHYVYDIEYDVLSSNAEHLLFFLLMFSHISSFSMNQLKLSFTEYFTTSVDQELAVSPSGS